MIAFEPDFSYLVAFATNFAAVRTAGADGVVQLGKHFGHLNVTTDAGNDELVETQAGRLILQTTGTDNDLIVIGFWGPYATAAEQVLPFDPVANSTIRFGTKFKVDDVSTCDVFCGLGVVDLDPFDAINSGIYFESLSAAAVTGVIENSGTETTVTLTGGDTGWADDTYIELGFVVHGRSVVDFYVNGVLTQETTMDNLTTSAMAPIVGIRNSSTATSLMTMEKWVVTQTMV